jgi:hypothetical protein
MWLKVIKPFREFWELLRTTDLGLCFSSLDVLLLVWRFRFAISGKGLGFSMSNKLPGGWMKYCWS